MNKDVVRCSKIGKMLFVHDSRTFLNSRRAITPISAH